MERDYFIKEVQKQFTEFGNSMYYNNESYIGEQLKTDNDSWIIETNISHLVQGSFYFIFYDLQGKSSKMEKYNPVLYLQSFDINNTREYYCLNINFLPIVVRTFLFNEILNASLKVIDDNYEVPILKQKPLNGIDFYTVYNMLKQVGFEWAIRKLDMRKINAVHKISTNILVQFITMSTANFTGVGDNKLIEIWQSKIKNRQEREKVLIQELLGDYNKVKKSFNEQFNSLKDREDNMRKSLDIIQNNI